MPRTWHHSALQWANCASVYSEGKSGWSRCKENILFWPFGLQSSRLAPRSIKTYTEYLLLISEFISLLLIFQPVHRRWALSYWRTLLQRIPFPLYSMWYHIHKPCISPKGYSFLIEKFCTHFIRFLLGLLIMLKAQMKDFNWVYYHKFSVDRTCMCINIAMKCFHSNTACTAVLFMRNLWQNNISSCYSMGDLVYM